MRGLPQTCRTQRRAMLALVAFGAACSDPIPSAPARVLGSSDRVVTCQGDVAARTLSCGMSSAPAAVASPAGFSADLIVGGQNTDVLLKSTNVRYDPATQIFQADVTVQNLLTPTLGTPFAKRISQAPRLRCRSRPLRGSSSGN